jgi:tetrahydromethanopterin:alpha-L-glutamate ligase
MTEEPGWHGEVLATALGRRNITVSFVTVMDCRFDLNTRYGIVIPGFENALPDGVFVRSVPGGTLEQVIARLDILHALRESGVPVYNDARAIERSVDKAMTSFLLRRANLPIPDTWVTEQARQARNLVLRAQMLGKEIVLKPLFGSMGAGLVRLQQPAELPPVDACQGLYYLQEFIDSGEGQWHDWRVFVIGGRAVAAMVRYGATWINNVARGGRCEAAALDGDLRQLAEAATAALQMDYSGVDIIRDRTGRAYVIEVNGIPAWKGLQSVCPESIAELLADDFVSRRLSQEDRLYLASERA